MNETVINLVNAIKSGDATATEQAFADAMSEKLGSMIDAKRQDLAASMFASTQEAHAQEQEAQPAE